MFQRDAELCGKLPRVWGSMRWIAAGLLVCAGLAFGQETLPDVSAVGHAGATITTPVNQLLTPVGRQVDLPGLRPLAVALSPDGKLLITAGKTAELLVLDPADGTIRQRVKLPWEDDPKHPREAPVSTQILEPDKKGQLSYTGLIFSPSGDRIYMSNVEGSIKVFAVDSGGTVTPERVIALDPALAPRRKPEIPSGLAISPDGTRLFVCGNLSNSLIELDPASGKVLRKVAVGVAPFDVRLVGSKAYVSNWGGRQPSEGDLTGPAGRGTTVRVDPIHHIASEGSVSVIDLASMTVTKEILTGLHASGLAVSPEHSMLICCNAGSDTLSVIDTKRDEVVTRIWPKTNASDLLSASPNAAAFDAIGQTLYVANGAQNAIAVIEFDPKEPHESRLEGLIPVGWYPGAIICDEARSTIIAANIKGIPKDPKKRKEGDKPQTEGFNSHHYFGSLSLIPRPSADALPGYSEQVAKNLRAPRIEAALLPPRPDQPARAIPHRIGEPSLIKHVVYIVKENRTFDQVMGDVPEANGHPELCIFGRDITPNHHAISKQFVTLDNTYCCGILSADGHQWSTTAFSTDYMEKSFAGFPRSYPDGMGEDEEDALAYAPSGFIWDLAIKHGKSLRNYGEFMGPKVRWKDPSRPKEPKFLDCYNAWKNKTDEVIFESRPSVESMRPFSPTAYVGWNMSVPDQWRADFILKELAEFERTGTLPQMIIICLPNDHGSGTTEGCPIPAACMADNDLAVGRIIEGFSRSKFWKDMAIFSIEDDPQGGWDHVSGYRTVAMCASPYTKRNAVISTQYNTTSILRTMEQILGLPPMNAFDASAVPMFDCFTDIPDLTPYTALTPSVPLDQMNPTATSIADPILRQDALVSASLNFREVDKAPEDTLNQIIWRAVKGSTVPYPTWAAGVTDDDD